MRFLVICINYSPEPVSVAPFNAGLCEHLAVQGHAVSVITAFPYYPHWRVYEPYRGMRYRREQINGVDVRRVAHFVPTKPRNLVQRLLHDMTFSLSAMAAIPSVGSFDAVFCSSPPPFTPLVGWLGALARRSPLVVKLTDLSADAAVSLGIMTRTSWLARWARALEGFGYRRARVLTVLCPAFKENLLHRGVPAEKIRVVPDWADTERVRPLPRVNSFRSANDLSRDEFVVLYAGNMGLKQGLGTAVAAAQVTESTQAGVRWLLVGDGEERERLHDEVRERRLRSLRFLPLQPSEVLPEALAAADVLLLVQRATVTDTVIPSKMLTYMAAGRPIVAAVNDASTTAHYVLQAGCGVVVPPEDPVALAQAVEELRRDPRRCEQMGRNGRDYVVQNFSRDSVLARYDDLFREVCWADR